MKWVKRLGHARRFAVFGGTDYDRKQARADVFVLNITKLLPTASLMPPQATGGWNGTPTLDFSHEPKRSAGFPTCCIADFQIGGATDVVRPAGLETRDTADLEVCTTSQLRFLVPMRDCEAVAARPEPKLKPALRLGRLVTLSFVLLSASCWQAWPATPVLEPSSRIPPHDYTPNRLLIQPKPDADRLTLDRFHSTNGCAVLRHFPAFGGVQVLRLAEGRTVPDLVARYQASGLVNFAEPDYRVRLAGVFPNDPAFLDGKLWGLNNTGQQDGLPDADVDAPEAWGARTTASNVIVAVVDTGIRLTHEDLAGNLWVNPRDGSHGLNAIAGSNDPTDDNGHGTILAGVIGATGNNGVGVAGAAWRVQLMACKFVDAAGNGSIEGALACLDFARTNGARIINASWGLDDFSLSLSNAIVELRQEGILVVAAAGNDARDIDIAPYFPASFDSDIIITVAATTRSDAVYLLSNYGPTNVDLAAPGYEIFSTAFSGDNAYAWDEGTSMAAAYTSGAAALLRAAYPVETPAQIIQRLVGSVDPLPALTDGCVSGGRLNLRKALGVPLSAPVLRPAVASPGGSFLLQLTGDPGLNYVMETATNFLDWQPVSTNLTGFNGTFTVTNGPTTQSSRRFYRAYLAP